MRLTSTAVVLSYLFCHLAKFSRHFTTQHICYAQWGAFYLFIADFFATQIIGGAKELVVLL